MKICFFFLVLLLCASHVVAQQKQQDPVDTTTTIGGGLHIAFGAGLQQGLFGGVLWRIPITDDLEHWITPEATFGFRPGRGSYVWTGAFGWQYLSLNSGLGGELKVKASYEKWRIDPEDLDQWRISLSPGLVGRLGKSLITLSFGPGVAFITRSLESGGKQMLIKDSELAMDATLSLTF